MVKGYQINTVKMFFVIQVLQLLMINALILNQTNQLGGAKGLEENHHGYPQADMAFLHVHVVQVGFKPTQYSDERLGDLTMAVSLKFLSLIY